MTISIITTTFNSADTVRDTLECIKQQTHNSIEHIIVDGLSKDDTLEIVNSYPHVSTIVSEKDKGIYDAMNKGLTLARGEVIGILNSDDIYVDKDVLMKVANVFANENVDVCYADLQYVHQQDLNKILRTWKSGKLKTRSFYRGWMPPHPTVFVRRKVYDKVGNFNLSLKSAADYELMLRIFVKNHFHVHYLPEIIVKMRAGGISNASILHRIRANKEDREAWRINGLQPRFYTLYLKPIRKITQFFKR
ncbi:glycosyltransferase family 2 protein [Pinibacter soli]|uniref:Glycosyltransferase family 2 protein n=1 Tax=Pinibacter soli TaxID=3044211 RepID=A0ABT6R9P0_9BACT|nr:glycosyltransferase family 2 protein [Pinibacter soli]MDI3318614.1 glycosyltransferase family 2 protein [Pinibacter soli]